MAVVVEHPIVNTPPIVRSHGGGVAAMRLPPGDGLSWAPTAKRRRLARKRGPPLPFGGVPSGITTSDAKQEAPLLLGPEQKESLGEYIDRDSDLLKRVGWAKFVGIK
jgi:hypothetical protein